jgi:hypothetical protein
MRIALELEIPDGALDKNAQAGLVLSAKEQTVLKLYADDLVTTGEAVVARGPRFQGRVSESSSYARSTVLL